MRQAIEQGEFEQWRAKFLADRERGIE